MKSNNYNGWANYATWRVNLEFFEGCRGLDVLHLSAHAVAKLLKERVEEYISEACDDGAVQGWALAFVNECDFQEIAEHMIDDERGSNNEQE